MQEKSVLVLGSFDGVHIGHRALIEKSVKIAKSIAANPIVYCFSQTPQNFFGNVTPQLLTAQEKKKMIEDIGAKAVIEDFTKEIEIIEADEFAKAVSQRFSPIDIVIGYDYKFGHKAAGDSDLLVKLGNKFGFGVHVVDAILMDSEPVSSTRIRNCLLSGNIKKANELLGYDFFYSGVVKQAKKLGSRLGFPTLNLNNVGKIIPKRGVYLSYVQRGTSKNTYASITNIGTNPSVSDSDEVYVETHVLEEIDQWYGDEIYVRLVDFVRPEKKFESLGHLKTAVEKDIKFAKTYWNI